MSEGKSGLTAALEATGPGAPPAGALQPSLPTLAPQPALPGMPEPEGPRAAHRPRSSRNRRTQEWIDWLLRDGQRSPVEFLASLYQGSTRELAEREGLYLYHEGKPVLDAQGNHVLAIGEALKRRIEAAIAVAPYLHQKLPIALDVKGKTAGVILIGELPAEGSDQAAALALFMPGEIDGESEQNQALSDGQAEQSDGSKVGNEAN